MKTIVAVKPFVTREAGATHYSYPEGYNSEKISVLGYGPIDGEENCIGVINQEDLADFIATDRISEISQEEASRYLDEWNPQTTTIVDQEKVLTILAKQATGRELDETDLKALDPEDPELGINKSTPVSVTLAKIMETK